MNTALSPPANQLAVGLTDLAQEALAWLAEQEDGVAFGAPHEYAATLRHARSLRSCVTVTRRKNPRMNQTQCVYTITPTGREVAALLSDIAPPPEGTGVYFIQGHTTRLIKIGYARNIAGRLTMLQCGSPDLMSVIGYERAPFSRERELHQMFSLARMHGEWFYPTPALLDYIADLQIAVAA